MSISAITSTYVLTEEGAATLAKMLDEDGASICSPGFVSRLREIESPNKG